MTPTPPPRNGPSFGQAVVLFLAGALLLSTTCFGMFGLEKGIPGDLQPLVFVPLLGVAAGMLTALVAFVAALVRRFTRTVPAIGTEASAANRTAAADGQVAAPVPPASAGSLARRDLAGAGRPTFGQALALVAAGCVLFLSLCAGVYNSAGGRAGWVAGPILLMLLAAALYGFTVMVLRVVQSFGAGAGDRR